MQASETLKTVVRETYTAVANQSRQQNASSCCGSGPSCCSPVDDAAIMADDYSQIDGYVAEADLGLGCGLPTQFARIQPGDTVIDLGSGAGNDCFVARHETGPAGKVIGIDFTDAMIDRARRNADQLGFKNVEFRFGDIEQMPVADASANVVVSNCVLNLVPNKRAMFREIFRVLKPGGHFSISDIVLQGQLPGNLRDAAELYAGCVSGAIQKADYLALIQETGFTNLTIQKDKPVFLPDDILRAYLTPDEIAAYRQSGTGIVSVTVYAEKPGSDVSSSPKTRVQLSDLTSNANKACQPGSGCC
ncbi:arsenite methyltransferase [Spirosoma taeanense]|uniref:Arsenite methyltransferase n=1 Tax=Spirosoma taeanense TaxID=2735870 RepID=A0A6M5Y5F9_9BACT|nr:arsenite methyltransferase [Spirosoma taeanense]QJW89035.1 arsenite methyltransferase [Spirosoma taeanense]